jgi:hypothetical protein
MINIFRRIRHQGRDQLHESEGKRKKLKRENWRLAFVDFYRINLIIVIMQLKIAEAQRLNIRLEETKSMLERKLRLNRRKLAIHVKRIKKFEFER